MSNSPRRDARAIIAAESEAAARRIARAELEAALVERVAPGIAPIDPAALMRLFGANPAAAWAALSQLTRPQLINQAIETAAWLEGCDIPVLWGAVLDRWEVRLAMPARLAEPIAA